MKTNVLRIMIIDHDQQSHEGYRYFFSTYTDYQLVGICRNVKQALLNYKTLSPDIVLAEVDLPEINGIEAIQYLRNLDATIKVIVLSESNDFVQIKHAFKNNANGYLIKPINKQRLHHALDSIKFKGAAMSMDIAKKLIDMLQKKSYDSFSKRENQIIHHLCQGSTYKMIAEKLFITTSAVNFHIQNVYLKLNVNSKSEALRKLKEMEEYA